MKVIYFSVILFTVQSEAKIFTRCRLAKELNNLRLIERTFLGNWVCLIEKVSNRDTNKFVRTPSGKQYYGLIQIPGKWCKEGREGGDCNIACESLLDDNIKDDTACAVNIFHKEGFKYWTQWKARCKNQNLITNEIYKPRGRKPTFVAYSNTCKLNLRELEANKGVLILLRGSVSYVIYQAKV